MLASKSIVSIQSHFRATSKVPVITAGFHTTTSTSKSSAALDHHSQNNHPNKQRKFHSLNCDTPYQLCFLRHGQSTWNRDNRFIGWTDTPLTDDGVLEARVAGQMLARSGMKFDEVHTSLLRRCIRTTNLVLMEMKQEYIPVHKHWRLNERHYGNLVGKNKKEVVKLHGQEQVRRWRRSWDEPPPPMEDDHKFHPALDPRYRDVSGIFACISSFLFKLFLKLVYMKIYNSLTLTLSFSANLCSSFSIPSLTGIA